MPSHSKAQHRFFAAACAGKGKAKIGGKAACEWMHADKGKVKNMPERKKRK